MAKQPLRGTTAEHTVNDALGEVLGKRLRSWSVGGDRRGEVLQDGGWPDVLLLDAAGWPVAIEAKHHGNYRGAEESAGNRLGKRPADSGRVIETVIALVYPDVFLALSGEELRSAIRTTHALEYALYSRADTGGEERVPDKGWMRGSHAHSPRCCSEGSYR